MAACRHGIWRPIVNVTQLASEPGRSRNARMHSRLLAIMLSARHFGVELHFADFRGEPDQDIPTAAALCNWAQSGGMCSRMYRTNWQGLVSGPHIGPVV